MVDDRNDSDGTPREMRSMRSRTSWLARLARGRRLDRNPLRRGSDRAETVVLGVLLAGFLAAGPFAAHTAGSWAYAASARQAQAQRAALRQVPATLMQAPGPAASYPGAGTVPLGVGARWRAPDGQERTGELVVPAAATAGSTVPLWVDQASRPVPRSATPSWSPGLSWPGSSPPER
jgi:hypothetical protein